VTALLTDSLVNEAAEEMICKLFPGDQRWAGASPEYHRKGFIKGAFHARSIYEARLAEREKLWRELLEHLGGGALPDGEGEDGSCSTCNRLRSALGLPALEIDEEIK